MEGPASSRDGFPPRVTLLGLTSLCTYPFSWIPPEDVHHLRADPPGRRLGVPLPRDLRPHVREVSLHQLHDDERRRLLTAGVHELRDALATLRSLSALISREDVLSSRSILIATSFFFPVGSCSSTALYTSANWPLPRGLGPTTRKRPFRRSPSRKIGMGSVSTGLIRRVDAPLGLIIAQIATLACWRAWPT